MFSKIKSLKKINFDFGKIAESFSARHWSAFLTVLLTILAAILIFDGWVFWEFSLKTEQKVLERESSEVTTIRKDIMESVFEKISEKEKNFLRYQDSFEVEDPS